MSSLAQRRRCKIDGAVSRLRAGDWLTLEQAAERLGISTDDFSFHLLLGRIPQPIDGYWSAAKLELKHLPKGTRLRVSDVKELFEKMK